MSRHSANLTRDGTCGVGEPFKKRGDSAAFADHVHLSGPHAAFKATTCRATVAAMRVVLMVLLGIALPAVLVVLAAGFFALFRGGEFGRRWSNKLMQYRVIAQAVAIALLAGIVWLAQAGRSG
jgi:hypothetical protein